jgi:hypothetical protein
VAEAGAADVRATTLLPDWVLATDPTHELWIDRPGARLSAAQLRSPDLGGVVVLPARHSGNLTDRLIDMDASGRSTSMS